ncbi:MAG: class I SAM-dependent methyltransferase [Deltaproteobacteria bacterium]|jgi:predicted O-methyltransferase YrrM|nr:class I SAM-dependent methyltransferase [Deltaproteobacteria bacterium]
MITLDLPRVAAVIENLISRDQQSQAKRKDLNLSEEEIKRLMGSKTQYLEFYSSLADWPLSISHETGRLIYMLAKSRRATSIIEYGTSLGVSTLFLAAALRDNGGGRLITCEFVPSKVAEAKANLEAAGLSDLVEFRAGNALETLKVDLPKSVDLLLLDGAKALYAEILALVEKNLAPGALIIADDAHFCPEYLALIRASQRGYLSAPLNEGVELTMRLI